MNVASRASRGSLPALLHPFTSWSTQTEESPRTLVSGRGVWVTDSFGRELLDGFAGLWCVNLGYGCAELIEAATAQLRRLPYATTFFNFASEPALELADRLAEVAPAGLRHILFTGGGSEAVDSALKLIRQYFTLLGQSQRRHFISLQRSYHGVSFFGASLTGIPACHRFFDSPGELNHHLPSPYPYRSSYGSNDAQIIRESVRALENTIAQLGARNVAAFFCEPVQGSGGIIVPPRGWLGAMREACRQYDVLFVADEVITGFCRTGRMFGCDWEAVQPDLMTVAKGLTSGYIPMGAVLLHERIAEVLATAAPNERTLSHGYTYTGHPVAAAVANAALDINIREQLATTAESRGQRLMQQLAPLRELPQVGDVRGHGLLAAIELVRDRHTREPFPSQTQLSERVRAHAYASGLIVRAFAEDIIGLAPALIATAAEIDDMAGRLRSAVERACEEVH